VAGDVFADYCFLLTEPAEPFARPFGIHGSMCPRGRRREDSHLVATRASPEPSAPVFFADVLMLVCADNKTGGSLRAFFRR